MVTGKKYTRRMPGRVIGVTINSRGKPVLRMAMPVRLSVRCGLCCSTGHLQLDSNGAVYGEGDEREVRAVHAWPLAWQHHRRSDRLPQQLRAAYGHAGAAPYAVCARCFQ